MKDVHGVQGLHSADWDDFASGTTLRLTFFVMSQMDLCQFVNCQVLMFLSG